MQIRYWLLGLCLGLFVLPLLSAQATRDELISKNRYAIEKGDFKLALQAADELVKQFPKEAISYFIRGETLDLADQYDKALIDLNAGIQLDPKVAKAYDIRGSVYFKLGKMNESLADFDQAIELAPRLKEAHWRRGITLYYAGKYQEGADQFELGKRVYKDDVENAFWHWLCLCRAKNVEEARKVLLPIGRDARIPLMKILELIQEKAKPADVLAECDKLKENAEEYKTAKFYGHLYLGLYFEAIGQPDQVEEHLALAAGKFYDKQYMGEVAKVHLQRIKKK